MLFESLVRLRSLTLATPENFWVLSVLQKKIKKIVWCACSPGKTPLKYQTRGPIRGFGPKVDSRSEKSKLDLAVPRGFYRVPDHF